MPPGAELGMKSFFEPKSVAVAGVSTDPDKLGSIIFANMTENSEKGLLKARVYALNPAHDRIGSHPCYPSIEALPEAPELLIVAVPESQTVDLVRRAADAGVKAAVMITGGFAEVGKADVEEKIAGLARRHGMRVLGPNTIGLVD
ncbi:MAG TPA: CoA-binding protein, partial [Nitrososphaerales archaeon]|nr:CoA-binding protein [Nitrososphaerales archaeon]